MRTGFLTAMRDYAFTPAILDANANEPVLQSSLLREIEMSRVRERFRRRLMPSAVDIMERLPCSTSSALAHRIRVPAAIDGRLAHQGRAGALRRRLAIRIVIPTKNICFFLSWDTTEGAAALSLAVFQVATAIILLGAVLVIGEYQRENRQKVIIEARGLRRLMVNQFEQAHPMKFPWAVVMPVAGVPEAELLQRKIKRRRSLHGRS